jgi:predicted DNA-binding transcriptional regulator AlpA
MTLDEMTSALSGQLVPINQAALITGYGQSTIRRWIKQGKLKTAGFPHAYRVCLGDILNPTLPLPPHLEIHKQNRIRDNKARRKAR